LSFPFSEEMIPTFSTFLKIFGSTGEGGRREGEG
jgi:hypothetical protein